MGLYERNFDGYLNLFEVKLPNDATVSVVRCNRKSEIRDGGSQKLISLISACRQGSNIITTATTDLSGSSCPTEPVLMMYDQTVRNRKWKIQDDGP